jgi:hypothetical protein
MRLISSLSFTFSFSAIGNLLIAESGSLASLTVPAYSAWSVTAKKSSGRVILTSFVQTGGLAIILWRGTPVYRRILEGPQGPSAASRKLILATLVVGFDAGGLLATHGHHSVFNAFA